MALVALAEEQGDIMVSLNKQKYSIQDNANRQAGKVSWAQEGVIVGIHPRYEYEPGDPDGLNDSSGYYVVDVMLRDKKDVANNYEKQAVFERCNVLQRNVGYDCGNHWQPRLGDVVVIMRLHNSTTPVVIGQLYHLGQLPTMSPTDDHENTGYLFKYTQDEPPYGVDEYKNFLIGDYYPPAGRLHPTCRPVCSKIFSKNRDKMDVFECPLGFSGSDPECMNCVSTNYPIVGADEFPTAMIRQISREDYQPDGMSAREPSLGEVPYRWQLLHHSGSSIHLDEDSTVQVESAYQTVQRGHLLFKSNGDIEVKSHLTGNTITMTINGDITVTASSKVVINAPVLEVNATDYVDISAAKSITLEAPEIDIKGRTYTSES